MIESACDHREIAQQLDLLHFQPEAPGMVFWHERGFVLYRLLEEAVREQIRAQGFAELRTPQLMRRPVWDASGHWSHFYDGMFRVEDQACEAAIKPVSCPGHIYVLKQRNVSYRELPLRLAELGNVHRDEPSGTLHGLLRLRQFTQDDGHIFCTEEQAHAELLRFCRGLPAFYRAFGFEQIEIAFSSRPPERAGDDAAWDRSEAALLAALRELGQPFVEQPGAGAFYGPKLEFALRDRHGRSWQCGTIQFDLVLPKRFGLTYVTASGAREYPVMLHRALYGSLERFLGIVLEQHGTQLPGWFAPVQVHVLPVAAAQLSAAEAFRSQLVASGLRAQVNSEESLARRVAEAHAQAVPYVAVIGAREAAADSVSLRERNTQRELSKSAALAELTQRCARPRFVEAAQQVPWG
ncbi:MAG TPA: threonine--tRNA ligase [Polyangiales bacterium]|nr:threonine--tRNA ligase [Polyangiales bacterium]